MTKAPLVVLLTAIALSVVAYLATVYQDKLPWLAATCKAYEPCKIKMDDMVITMTPVPVAGGDAHVTTVDPVTRETSVYVTVPVNTSATVAQ